MYRLWVGQTGQLYWPDEYRYLHALHVLDELRKGDLREALHWIFGVEAGVASRPSYILLSLLPAVGQGVANIVFDLPPTHPSFYTIPVIFNVMVSVALAMTIYALLDLVVEDHWLAAGGAALHGMLANTNLYVRHLFPYDLSLLLFLLSLVVLLGRSEGRHLTSGCCLIAGILTGAAATTYPGYNLFVLIPMGVLAAARPFAWRPMATFIVTAFGVVAFWEAIARVGGYSFIGASKRFSTTFTPETLTGVQGAYDEGFRFLPLYLIEVEGLAGILLALLLVVFLVLAIWGRFERLVIAIVGTALVAYLVYAIAVQVLHWVVFYGRLVHMYLPFVVLAATLVMRELKNPSLRYGATAILLVAVFASFAPTAVSAMAIRFPKDVERILAGGAGQSWKICKAGQPAGGREAPLNGCDVVLVNAQHLYPLPEQWKSSAPAGFSLAGQFAHPMQFRPYWFEGYTPQERARLQADPPMINVFSRSGRLFSWAVDAVSKLGLRWAAAT
ncbi:MAG: hypothetical protein FJ245_05380 [Nitrospira sp.]|nr:hypothetical protein [Nitrospira sp.]